MPGQQRCSALWCVLLLLLLCSACRRSYSYEERVSTQLVKLFPTERLKLYQRIVFVPNGGCAGCIQQAENFYLQSKGDSTTLFVFTNYISRKDLQIKLGKDLPANPNVWLDEDNILYFPKYPESLYPCLIVLSDGKISRFANLDELLP